MNKQLQDILAFLKPERLKKDRRIVVFLICLLIATILWFLNALSKNYTTTVSYSVKYNNPPENLFLANDPPDRLNLEVQAHGFSLLRQKLSFSVSPIILNLSAIKNAEDAEETTFSVETENLIRRVSEQVSSEISVLNIEPKIIRLVFDSLKSKMVPVTADVNLQFTPQFFLNGDIQIQPDSVQLTGPAGIIDTVDSLKTKPYTFEELKSQVDLMAPVVHPEKTKVVPKKINLKIPVERFTEKRMKVPVQVLNVPENINIKIFPSEVEVSFLIGLSDYENISSTDFDIVADYSSAENKEVLEVVVMERPDFIQQLRISPPNVEYLIENKE